MFSDSCRCSGGSLQEDVDKNGVFKEIHTARVMLQLMDAIRYIHSQNVSHRDLKVTSENSPK